jgi:hypothetical protein
MPLTFFGYQVVGYDWADSHWINKQITRHTHSSLNHIGVRFYIGGSTYETFVGPTGSDNLVSSHVLARKYSPEIINTALITIPYETLMECINLCDNYGSGSVPYAYLWWYTGKLLPPPKSCTDLAYRCLRIIGLDVTERALPNQLFKEVTSCM